MLANLLLEAAEVLRLVLTVGLQAAFLSCWPACQRGRPKVLVAAFASAALL